MEKWKVTARFPDTIESFSMDKADLIEKFSGYLPAVAKPEFKSLMVSIGDLDLSIIPETKKTERTKRPWKKRNGQKRKSPKN